jgi:O-antigen/teichoic acid export membrane protein
MRYRIRNITPDILIAIILFVLPLMTFWGQTVGENTLLPADNLYQSAPYATYREEVGAPEVPHNPLLSDMVFQNMQWKAFIRDSIAAGEVPLWNPHQFAGVPFMAAGQASTLYPLNALYYIMPLAAAYGWFVVVNLWIIGLTTYGYLRGLRLRRAGAVIGAVTFQHSGFLLASAVFPMMLAGVAWLPLLLLMVEYTIRARPAFGRPAVIPWVVIGAIALGMNILAGHVEITYYTVLITALYGAVRGMHGYWTARDFPNAVRKWSAKLGWMLAMGVLGVSLGALQVIPLYELVSTNWRAEGKTFQETLTFAHPARDVVQFVMPNFYGSPAQHDYLDVFDFERRPVGFVNSLGQQKTNTEWGIKNYVEGALYLGILPLALAVYALVDGVTAWWANRGRRRTPAPPSPPYRVTFAALGVVSLTFMFGAPTYALIYYGLPGLDQSHTPFRWVYALTLCVAALAAFGWERLGTLSTYRVKQVYTWLLLGGGIAALAGLGLSYALYATVTEDVVSTLLGSLAKANEAFPDARVFYSHLFVQVLTFGVVLTASGVIFWLMTYTVHKQRRRTRFLEKRDSYYEGRRGLWARYRPGWADFATMNAVMLVAMDLMLATGGFNPAVDAELLDFTPPVIQWMTHQPGHWRYITLDDPAQPPMLPANVTWRYGLDDVRGYESIITRDYMAYMDALYPQVQRDFNRIAPLYTTYDHVGIDFDYRDALTDPRFHLLNIRYVVTHPGTAIDVAGYDRVHETDGAWVYENENAAPRAFIVPRFPDDCADATCGVPTDDIDPVDILSDTGRELVFALSPFTGDDQLVVSQAYFPGWRAYLQVNPNQEISLDVRQVAGNLTAIELPDTLEGQPIEHFSRTFDVRLVYSPLSAQVGGFGSAIGGMTLLLMLGVWAWRRFVVSADVDRGALLARNSLAPVLLNLFNRGIDFVLAFVVLRVLGPEDTGIYYYAVIVFVWFDIFTNFGLDVYLMREVSRDRSRGRYLFVNTTVFRLLLSAIGVVLLLGFILARQSLVPDPFDTHGIIALVLLYLGLVPGSLSKGMTSLYYAHERAEYPAAVSTVTTISKAVLGVAVLLLGYGIIGLAGVSIFNNFVTLGILMFAGRDMLRVEPSPPWSGGTGEVPLPQEQGFRVRAKLMRGMANESYPLMLNHFLATIFFQIDVVILEALRGAAVVGKYSVGYRWLLALNVIPAFFTMALFPRLSRQAEDDRAALGRNYRLSLKLLAAVVFPAAVLLTFWARPLTLLLGGRAFLPEGAIALQIMVWSMPLGWMNSLTQYVLIALNRQRQLTWAFAVGVAFNIVTNMIFIPIYGYRAAAVTTILSELILMIGFAVLLRGELDRIGMVGVLWRPGLAAGAMAAVMGLWGGNLLLATISGVIVYPLVWMLSRPLNADELETVGPLLPGPLRKRLVPAGLGAS